MPFLELWYQALRAQIGIIVSTTNRQLLINKLYAARAENHDPDLAGLSLIQSPTDPSQLWIVKKKVKLDEAL